MIDRMLELSANSSLESPASARQLAELRRALGEQTPPLLEQLLARTNGGELPICRFSPSPYLPPEGKDLWDHVASAYPPSDLIERKEFLPLGDDYGDALYCLNLRHSPPSVTLVPYHATSEDEFECAGETFEVFVARALEEMETLSRRMISKVRLALADPKSVEDPRLLALGVRLRFVDRAPILAEERNSSFPNPELLALYEDETRSLFFTLDPVQPGGDRPFAVANASNDLRLRQTRICDGEGQLSSGEGLSYLTDWASMTRYPVWSLTCARPLNRQCYLELELEHDPC